ncbi:MAG: beta-propeller fold lactonase family protein [Capsulimonadaceae bacterium]
MPAHRTLAFVITRQGLSAFRIGFDGHLRPVSAYEPYIGGYPFFIATAPTGHVVYTGGIVDNDRVSGYIDRLRVTSTGDLDYAGGAAAGGSPGAPVFGRGGQFVYVYADLSLLAYSAQSRNDLRPLDEQEITIGSNGLISADPLGQFVWALMPNHRRFALYRVTKSGALEHFSDLVFGDRPGSITWRPGGSTAYIAFPDTGVMRIACVDRAGRASIVQSAKLAPDQASLRILGAHPSGRFVYASCNIGGKPMIIDIATEPGRGMMTGTIYEETTYPSSAIAVTPDGRFAYTSDNGTNVITQYRIANNGTLTRCSTRQAEDDVLSLAISAY